MQDGWLEATEIVVNECQINNPQTDQTRIKMGLKTDHTNQILGFTH